MHLETTLAASILAAPLLAVATERDTDPDSTIPPGSAFEAVYTADLWRNSHGGLRTGSVYLDNLDLTFSIAGSEASGLRGLKGFAHVLYTNSAVFSERYVGDAMTASNIDAPRGVRLYELWVEWVSNTARPFSTRFGLYDLNSEFDVNDSRSLFLHSAHGVGHELGQTGENGPSIFPVTSLGVRTAWEPAEGWRVLAALLDGAPGDRNDPNSAGIYLSSGEGALAIAETQWSGGRITKLALGHWRYTADFADLRSTPDAPLPERGDNVGSYASLEVALGGGRAGEEAAATAFVRYGVANGRINEFDEFLGVGLQRTGLSATRPNDQVGIALSWASVSAATRSAALAAGSPRDRYEAALELTWRAPINDWLTIQPDAQWILNPGADPSIRNSLVLGVRFEISMAFFQAGQPR